MELTDNLDGLLEDGSLPDSTDNLDGLLEHGSWPDSTEMLVAFLRMAASQAPWTILMAFRVSPLKTPCSLRLHLQFKTRPFASSCLKLPLLSRRVLLGGGSPSIFKSGREHARRFKKDVVIRIE